MDVLLDPNKIEDYQLFLAIKRLPSYRIRGRMARFPDEYAKLLGLPIVCESTVDWMPSEFLWDYQKAIVSMALRKRKYAVFADCGLGKTLIFLEFAQGAMQSLRHQSRGMLIVSPLMVIEQTLAEATRWYPGLNVEHVHARNLKAWMETAGGKIGITNYEAIRNDLERGEVGGIILDESSMLKSHYGKWGTKLIQLGKGCDWKMCCTGTPAPNDRIEYANHAVFLDHFPTVNSFLATYFINRGQTSERWVLKDHALQPFYRALAHWCIFLANPSTYGWCDNVKNVPPIQLHIHDVDLTLEQQSIFQRTTGQLFASDIGGIVTRSMLGQLAKGRHNGRRIATNKSAFIRSLVDSWPDESTIIWCIYNAEQDAIKAVFPEAVNIDGSTPYQERMTMIDAFKKGQRRIMISKAKVLGFGLNLQMASRHVFSGLQDSYESYYQAVKRSNRYGATKPLNVHIPVTDLEMPMVQNVLRKARMVQLDTEEQERIFKSCAQIF